MNEVIGVDILDDEDIDINYKFFIDEDIVEGTPQEFGVLNNPGGPIYPHPSKYVSRTFYIFAKRL